MAYLIPKSARNVKMQLFKGLGVIEVVIVILTVMACFLIFNSFDSLDLISKVAICLGLALVTVFLVSPSFIVNKKGYQCFGIIFGYMYQQKKFKNKRKVK